MVIKWCFGSCSGCFSSTAIEKYHMTICARLDDIQDKGASWIFTPLARLVILCLFLRAFVASLLNLRGVTALPNIDTKKIT